MPYRLALVKQPLRRIIAGHTVCVAVNASRTNAPNTASTIITHHPMSADRQGQTSAPPNSI
ncbi:MAG: hypothetical protein FWB94_02615 [Chitinispirillia bacterium]|nr:hypothetical protein [Chitinispirillia bacterium]